MSLKGKVIAFIPTASIHEEYTQYVEEGKEAFASLGFIVRELEITQCDSKEIKPALDGCDYIYISGGNTFFLMQELRRNGVDKLIVEQIRGGKPYIGESAGAMIVAPHIGYAKEMDDPIAQTPNFKDFKGLGLVDFYPVPHFNSFPFEEETRRIEQAYCHLPLKPIGNGQAIVVKGENISICGED